MVLLRRFEQNHWEFASQVALPGPCVLRRDQVDLVEHLDHFLARLLRRQFDFLRTAAFGVSRVQHLQDHVGGVDDFFELFVIGASALGHLTRVWVEFAHRLHEQLSLSDLLGAELSGGILLELEHLRLDTLCVRLHGALGEGFLGLFECLQVHTVLFVKFFFALQLVKHIVFERV